MTTNAKPPQIAFNEDQSQVAFDKWRFNCGPGALCAVLQVEPQTIRPHLLSFEQKGYINPSLMFSILSGLGLRWKNENTTPVLEIFRRSQEVNLGFGLMRVQWDGPWCAPSRPIYERYRHTHWVAVCGNQIFDINALHYEGWLWFWEWHDCLVPWILDHSQPKATGKWWPTHLLTLDRGQCLEVGARLANS